MRGGGKSNQDQETEDDYEEDDFVGPGNDRPSSSNATINNNNTTTIANSNKDGKNSDKISAMRSKHSVTEQRRRSKINERFQILRDLIPHSDQKRDTASFLFEVIEYVRYLQEKVQKYEGSYQGLSPEATKLMPWRNSHWRVQSFVGQPQAMKNSSGPVSTFPGKLEENNMGLTPAVLGTTPITMQSDSISKIIEQPLEHANEGMMHIAPSPVMVASNPLQLPVSEMQSAECPIMNDTPNQQDDLVIEGGTINVSAVYSNGLLSTLVETLQSAGIDLSQAKISVQIDLGKQEKGVSASGASLAIKDSQNTSGNEQDQANLWNVRNGEHSGEAQKRLKT